VDRTQNPPDLVVDKPISTANKVTLPFNTITGVLKDQVTFIGSCPPSYQTKWTKGDGNCQFTAFARGLPSGQHGHLEVRKAAISWMRTHPDEFVPFMSVDFNQYLVDMSKPGSWGDNYTLQAMCKAYKVYVIVHKVGDNGEGLWSDWGDKHGCQSVFWLYLRDYHYENLLHSNQISM
jgi:hypothetical protein